MSNLSKMRVDLRLFADLIITGVISQKDGLPILGKYLKGLISSDKKEHCNVPIVYSLCKYCGQELMGLVPQRLVQISEELGRESELPKSDFLAPERQIKIKQLIKDYYTSLTEHIMRQHNTIKKQTRDNERMLDTRGEVDEGRINALSTGLAVLERLMDHAACLSPWLNVPMPDLPAISEYR